MNVISSFTIFVFELSVSLSFQSSRQTSNHISMYIRRKIVKQSSLYCISYICLKKIIGDIQLSVLLRVQEHQFGTAIGNQIFREAIAYSHVSNLPKLHWPKNCSLLNTHSKESSLNGLLNNN